MECESNQNVYTLVQKEAERKGRWEWNKRTAHTVINNSNNDNNNNEHINTYILHICAVQVWDSRETHSLTQTVKCVLHPLSKWSVRDSAIWSKYLSATSYSLLFLDLYVCALVCVLMWNIEQWYQERCTQYSNIQQKTVMNHLCEERCVYKCVASVYLRQHRTKNNNNRKLCDARKSSVHFMCMLRENNGASKFDREIVGFLFYSILFVYEYFICVGRIEIAKKNISSIYCLTKEAALTQFTKVLLFLLK